jgi:uncharacterized lipoprotein YajG
VTGSIRPTLRGVSLLAGVALLAGCMAAPQQVRTAPRAPLATGPATPTIAPADIAGAAERACITAGQERGLQVIGIAGSRDVTGPTGTPMRDVMLRVSRSGAQIEVRCNYQSDSDLARIMLI